jgi:hypothetical protein
MCSGKWWWCCCSPFHEASTACWQCSNSSCSGTDELTLSSSSTAGPCSEHNYRTSTHLQNRRDLVTLIDSTRKRRTLEADANLHHAGGTSHRSCDPSSREESTAHHIEETPHLIVPRAQHFHAVRQSITHSLHSFSSTYTQHLLLLKYTHPQSKHSD